MACFNMRTLSLMFLNGKFSDGFECAIGVSKVAAIILL